MSAILPGGIEPYYDLQVASRLIPYPYVNLRKFLSNHKYNFPVVYRKQGRCRRRIRLLRESEVIAIRELVLVKS